MVQGKHRIKSATNLGQVMLIAIAVYWKKNRL